MVYPHGAGPTQVFTGDARLTALEQMVQSLQTRVTALESGGARPRQPSAGTQRPSGSFFAEFVGGERIPCIASRDDLIEPDGTIKQYADPKVYKDPPRWKGASYVGRTYSDCPPDYLRDLASLKRWQAGKEHEEKRMSKNNKPAWLYSLRDASKADGWAKLIEESQKLQAQGGAPQAPAQGQAPEYVSPDLPEDDIPF